MHNTFNMTPLLVVAGVTLIVVVVLLILFRKRVITRKSLAIISSLIFVFLIYQTMILSDPITRSRNDINGIASSLSDVLKTMEPQTAALATTPPRNDCNKSTDGKKAAVPEPTSLEKIRVLQNDLDVLRTLIRDDKTKSNPLPTLLQKTSSDLDAVSKALEGDNIRLSVRLFNLKGQVDTLKAKVAVLNAIPLQSALTRLQQILVVLVSWPTVILVLFIYAVVAAGTPSRIAELVKPLRLIKAFGAEIELGENTKSDVEGAIKRFRDQLQSSYSVLIQERELATRLRLVADDVVKPYIASHYPNVLQEDFRFTLHVPDLLFAESLYQLLDYYPYDPVKPGGGRAFSDRFGLHRKVLAFRDIRDRGRSAR